MKICKRCVVPENFPHITLDREGVCNLCRSYEDERLREKRLKTAYYAKFKALIKAHSGKGMYDLLLLYSGGKDSTYTLALLKERYGLNVLALTVDNGFLPERTHANIHAVVEKLGVDHIFFKPRFDVLKKVFVHSTRRSTYPVKAAERASAICTSCMGVVKYVAIKTAIEKGIPLIGFGWSPGQAPISSSILNIDPKMMKGMEGVTKKVVCALGGKAAEAYFLEKRHYESPGKFPVFVHPLALHPYNEKKILKYIGNLGWKMPSGVELNATNCLLNAFADREHMAKHGFHPYALEIAALVRSGCMTRDEGLRHLPVRKDAKVLRMVRRRLGI